MAHKGDLTKFTGVPKFNPMNLVHGEESIKIFKAIKPDTSYTVNQQICDI